MSDGDRPTIRSMYANSTDLIPYLDPGELATVSSGGSYIHWKNQRKRAISSNTLLDYDADQGPSGPTDIQYEPSGLILRVRTKQNRDQNAPRWNLHSNLSMYDNGDINLQSMVNSIPKGLLHMDGKTGYVFLMAGNAQIQEYIEMNPIKKEVLYFTDGEEHHHIQTNKKEAIYSNIVNQIGGGIQIQLGVDLSTIPANFDQMTASQVGPGDIYIDNSTTKSVGKATLHLKGDFDIITDIGNINVTVSQGNVNINVKGTTTINSQGDIDISTQGTMNFSADGDINFTSENFSVETSGEANFNKGGGNLVTSDQYNAHEHIWYYNGPNNTTPPTEPFGNNNLNG